jgi:hypothetical protein
VGVVDLVDLVDDVLEDSRLEESLAELVVHFSVLEGGDYFDDLVEQGQDLVKGGHVVEVVVANVVLVVFAAETSQFANGLGQSLRPYNGHEVVTGKRVNRRGVGQVVDGELLLGDLVGLVEYALVLIPLLGLGPALQRWEFRASLPRTSSSALVLLLNAGQSEFGVTLE